jgi:hypothetical protein
VISGLCSQNSSFLSSFRTLIIGNLSGFFYLTHQSDRVQCRLRDNKILEAWIY